MNTLVNIDAGGGIGKYLGLMKGKDPSFELVAAPYPVLNKGDKNYAMRWTALEPGGLSNSYFSLGRDEALAVLAEVVHAVSQWKAVAMSAGVGLKANEIDDRPVVIDFRTDYREKVYPMVAAGSSNDDVILGPSTDKAGPR